MSIINKYKYKYKYVDHDILFTQLRVSFGISGAALDWFQSYLTSKVGYMLHSSTRSTDTKSRPVRRATAEVCPDPPPIPRYSLSYTLSA